MGKTINTTPRRFDSANIMTENHADADITRDSDTHTSTPERGPKVNIKIDSGFYWHSVDLRQLAEFLNEVADVLDAEHAGLKAA